MKLLSINHDTKTIKGLEKGYLTGIMYLAPYTLGGKNLCPFAKAAGCTDACLYTAGRGKKGLIPVIRLNGTSDIEWENIRFDYEFIHNKIRSVTIFELFPEIQFYDYSKNPYRDNLPKNYDLTFSYSQKSLS